MAARTSARSADLSAEPFVRDDARSIGPFAEGENRLVHGDNLGAMEWLARAGFAERVRCAYLDPPYNTGRAFAEYDDALSDDDWCRAMRPRVKVLHALLAADGALFAEIDDTMLAPLHALLDETFGRANRVSTITIVRSASTGHKAINAGPVNVSDFLLVYAKERPRWRARANPQWREREGYDAAYGHFVPNLEEPPEAWRFESLRTHACAHLGYASPKEARAAMDRDELRREIERFAVAHADRVVRFAQPRVEAVSREARALIARSKRDPEATFRLVRPGYKDMILHAGDRVLFLGDKVRARADGTRVLVEPLTNVWNDVPFQGIAREGGVVFSRNKKPERLVERVLAMASDAGDWVLDPFLGSGTTAAVAHKMGRRWIGIEQGAQVDTMCLPRLARVVRGEDTTGITKTRGWKGGGGFGVYGLRLACSALSIVSLFLSASCARRSAPSPAPSPVSSVASSAPVAPDAALPKVGAWAEAVREERWEEAWVMLEALPDGERAQPEVRFARAHVALARGDGKNTLASLEGLDAALPLLADYVERERAEAQLLVGPYDAAASYYLGRGTAASLVRAAEAFQKAKAPARARAACDRVLGAEKRSRAQEAEARSIRLWLAADDPAEADDARWLAVHAPDLPWGKEADTALGKLAPQKPLTSDELLARAEALSLGGRTDDALRTLDRVEKAPGRRVNALERSRAKGDALYRGGKYGDAARVLSQCARAGGSHVAEDAFRAARALARADRDEEAIVALGQVAKDHAGTQWADQASFLIGRLELLHGRWKEATAALDAYVAKYPNGTDHHDAVRDRALARLLEGDAHGARALFEQLAEDEPDSLAAARARTMAALAAFRDGDRTHAIARWTDVARSRPLSWPALVARARLAQIGAPLPPLVDPGDADDASAPLSVTLPAPVELLHRIGLDADAENELHERESAVSAYAQGRSTEALCVAYGQLGRAKRRYQVAQQIPSALLSVAPTPKTRWSWDCAFPTPYPTDVDERAKESEISPALVYGVMRQESGFDPDALSGARAVGLLQLLPETAKTLVTEDRQEDATHLTSPPINITLGSRYLRDLLAHFHGVMPLAVAAYNAGPDAVTRWLSRPKGLDLDLFVERIPYAETRTYVVRVMGNVARYGYLRSGEAGVPVVKLEMN